MMRILSALLKLTIMLAVFTVIGQVPIRGRSLENRYHAAVNSPGFQEGYWALMTPFTWSYQKIATLAKSRGQAQAR